MATNLQPSLLRLSGLHFLYVGALAAQIIVYDAWQLLAPAAVLQRWTATALLLGAVTGIWYRARPGQTAQAYRRLAFLLILADIGIATFGVYTQRGMASRAVALYAIPLVVATILRSRAALFATAILCVASYFVAAIAYFVLHFNEGYKIELYGETGFYAATFLLLAGLLAVTIRPTKA